MVTNLILGLGGTGSKIVESFVHLCAAGLGPSRASVAFIDQDRSNGNTLRARTTLRQYASARKVLWAGDRPDCSLLRTRLDAHPDAKNFDNCLWVPQEEREANLAKLMRYSVLPEEPQGLARALFHDKDELQMNLNEGYRGRPHVGSAALLLQLGDDEFWHSLQNMVKESQEDEGVRIFLCGSAFGGTGAAVFPTLARRLRQTATAAGRPLRTAGVLMVPYFTFAPPKDREENVAAGHELLLQSQSALQYYHGEMEFGGQPYSFDDLYFAGWNPPMELNYHSAGAGTQANPPLAPELFGALAAARFFREAGKDQIRDGSERTKLHITTRSEPGRLSWEDLPSVSVEDGELGVQHAYAGWLRCCALWHFNYARAFAVDHPAGARNEAWYRRIIGTVKPDQTLDEFSDYVSAALAYAASLSAFSRWHTRAGEGSFDLWSHEPIGNVDRADPPAYPDLSQGGLAGNLKDFARLVGGLDKVPSAADVYWAISQEPRPDTRGLGAFLPLLHKHAGVRA